MLDPPDHVSSADPALGRVLRGGWKWLLVGASLGLIVGLALLFVLPKTYTADTSVIVRPVAVLDSVGTSATGTGTTEVNLDTEAQLVESLVVAESAQEALATDETADQLLSHVAVSVPPNTTILDISYADDSADAAREGAAAFAEAYLQQRQDSAEAALGEQQATLNGQANSLGSRLKKLSQAVSEAPVGSSERLLLSTQLRLLQSRLGAVQSSQVALRSTQQVAPGDIVSPAETPRTPTSPAPLLVLPSAVALGLLGGILLAWSTRWRRERILSPRDLSELRVGPVIAVTDAQESHSARGVQQLVQSLVTEGEDLLLVPASTKQSSLGPALVVGRQLAIRKGDCLLVVNPDEHRRVATADVDGTGLSVRTTNSDHRDWARDGIPAIFVLRSVNTRRNRPAGGIDFAVVTVRAGATSAAQLRKTVARLEGQGITVRGTLLDRGAPTGRRSVRDHTDGSAVAREVEPPVLSRSTPSAPEP